jgi:metal-responsive CopG/Arc/MetJ family transcriptional regulator
MITIAISIDEATLEEMDRLVASAAAGRRGRSAGRGLSRSEVVRLAVRQYLAQRRRAERDARDAAALAKNRERLAKQAAALVAEQATP